MKGSSWVNMEMMKKRIACKIWFVINNLKFKRSSISKTFLDIFAKIQVSWNKLSGSQRQEESIHKSKTTTPYYKWRVSKVISSIALQYKLTDPAKE